MNVIQSYPSRIKHGMLKIMDFFRSKFSNVQILMIHYITYVVGDYELRVYSAFLRFLFKLFSPIFLPIIETSTSFIYLCKRVLL